MPQSVTIDIENDHAELVNISAKRGTESTEPIHAPAGFKSASLRNVTQARQTPRIA